MIALSPDLRMKQQCYESQYESPFGTFTAEDIFCDHVLSLRQLGIPAVYEDNITPETFISHKEHFATVSQKMLHDPLCDIEDFDDAIMVTDLVLDIIIPNKHYTEWQINSMLSVRKLLLTDAKQKYKNRPNDMNYLEDLELSLQLRNLRERFRAQFQTHMRNFDASGRKVPTSNPEESLRQDS